MKRIWMTLLAVALAAGSCAAQNANDSPAQAAQWFAQGMQALSHHQRAAARAQFQQILRLQPAPQRDYLVGALVNLGVIAMQQRQWPAALTNFERARKLAPEVTGIRLNIGLSHFYQGTYAAAIPDFQSVLRDQPGSAQAYYFLGICYFVTNQYGPAEQMLKPLWQREQGNLGYLYALAVASAKTGDTALHQQAVAQLLRTGASHPDQLDLIRGRADLNRNRLQSAIASLEQAARVDPKLPYVHFSLGQACQALHQYDRALQEYQKDLALGGHDADDEESIGTIELIQGRLPQAEAELKRALASNPSLPGAHVQLGQLYLRTRRPGLALAQFTAAEKLVPDTPDVHYLRGRALRQLHRSREAQAEFAESTRLQNARMEKDRARLSTAQHP